MRHYVTVGLLVIFATVLAYFGISTFIHMPEQASFQAIPIDWIWNLQIMVISFLFALIVVPLVYSLIVFRRKPGDTSDAVHIEGHTQLEITWTVLPLITVLVFAYMGAWTLGETRRVDPRAIVINVTARQFAWSYEYPDLGGIVSEKLYLPVGQQVLLRMTSQDVIHSFWVPEFRVKQDVVPGRITELRITASRAGDYFVRCAELCGSAHYAMLSPVVALERAAFDAWVAEQQAALKAITPEKKGELLAKANGCLGCHSLTGQIIVGPTWKGLFGSKAELTDGTTVLVDEEYIKESILNPNAKIVAGFNPVMPAYQFSDEELDSIIAYLKTIR